MGEAAHGDDLLHCEGEIDARVLRNVGDGAGNVAAGDACKRLAIDEHFARSNRPEPGEGAQDGAFAAAVGPDEDVELARCDTEIDGIHETGAAAFDSDVAGLDGIHAALNSR